MTEEIFETNQIDVVATLREAAHIINNHEEITIAETGRLVWRLCEIANVYETARNIPLFDAAVSLEDHMGVDIDTFLDRQENGIGDYFDWHRPLAERGIRLIEVAKTHALEAAIKNTTKPEET